MNLEERIEEVRHHMYQAHRSESNYEQILKLSQELDHLLNKLRNHRLVLK